jgi:purine-binding chemotaxis protein CheW
MTTAQDNTVEHSQYLTFRVSGEMYAISVLEVREILPYTGATRVPLAPAAIRGLINVRGSAVPVIDLAVRLGLPEIEVSKRSCVLILDSELGEGSPGIGILTEEVLVVLAVGPDEIEPAPSFGTGVSMDHVCGMGKIDGQFVPILDVGRLLDGDELLLSAAAKGPVSHVEEAAQAGPSADLEVTVPARRRSAERPASPTRDRKS